MRNKLSSLLLLLTGRNLACGDWNVTLGSLKEAGLNMSSARELQNIPEEDTFANFSRLTESHGGIDSSLRSE